MISVIRAEWIKLRTTRSFYWTTALIVGFSLGMALVNGYFIGKNYENAVAKGNTEAQESVINNLSNSTPLVGLLHMGLALILVQSILFVTTEYANKTSKVSALMVPKRTGIAVGKLLVYGVMMAVIVAILAFLDVLLMRFTLGMVSSNTALLESITYDATTLNIIQRMVIASVLCVAFGVGLGYILRSSALSIAIILSWMYVAELLIINVPRLSAIIGPYLPFHNLNSALKAEDLASGLWGQTGSVLYFAAVALLIFFAGIIALKSRDA